MTLIVNKVMPSTLLGVNIEHIYTLLNFSDYTHKNNIIQQLGNNFRPERTPEQKEAEDFGMGPLRVICTFKWAFAFHFFILCVLKSQDRGKFYG